MSNKYLIPNLALGVCHQNELVIKKSRFITSVGHTDGLDEVKAFIAEISGHYHDASHNCYAYNAGRPGSTAFCGCSDDGEPHGTAGQPMLNIVQHSSIGEICCVVTRYFGGTLLGTGGLVKAYQDSIKAALSTLKTIERIERLHLKLVFDHCHTGKIMHLIKEHDATILDQSFNNEVSLKVLLPCSFKESFENKVKTLTLGTAGIVYLEDSAGQA